MSEKGLAEGRVYPRLKHIREISIRIALEVARASYEAGTATLYPEPEDKELYIRQHVRLPPSLLEVAGLLRGVRRAHQ